MAPGSLSVFRLGLICGNSIVTSGLSFNFAEDFQAEKPQADTSGQVRLARFVFQFLDRRSPDNRTICGSVTFVGLEIGF